MFLKGVISLLFDALVFVSCPASTLPISLASSRQGTKDCVCFGTGASLV